MAYNAPICTSHRSPCVYPDVSKREGITGICIEPFMLFSSKHSLPRYTQLHGSSDALALAQYAAQHSPLTIIAANALEAQRLVEEIPFFAPGLRVHLLPGWEKIGRAACRERVEISVVAV